MNKMWLKVLYLCPLVCLFNQTSISYASDHNRDSLKHLAEQALIKAVQVPIKNDLKDELKRSITSRRRECSMSAIEKPVDGANFSLKKLPKDSSADYKISLVNPVVICK